MSSRATSHFDRLARDYDALRPVDDGWWEVFEALVRAGDLRGRRVLEVGCGTGRLAAALADRAAARVWAVDASSEMAAAARASGVTVRVAPAEQLPFRDGWFERVVMRMVVHLLDAPAALAEARRVLRPDGILAVATLDPSWFGEHWLLPWFPSIPAIDAERFPTAERLEAELAAAGFCTTIERVVQDASMTRDEALAKMRGRAFSTFSLLPEDEYRACLAHAEAEVPARLDYRRIWLVASAVS
jgi:SAM-dependent methyltransferase